MLLEEQDSKSQVVQDLTTTILGFDQALKKVYSGLQSLIS